MSFHDPHAALPTGLTTAEFVLRPIQIEDAANDHAAVMETRVDLRLWEQSAWPEDAFTVDANREDLADLQRRHAERRAYTYTVLDSEGDECLGCVYIFPPTATFLAKSTVTAVAQRAWSEVDAAVYFWVRTSRVATAMDERLLVALRAWMTEAWGFERVVYVTSEQYDHQVRLLERARMTVQFEIAEPGKPAAFLAFE